MTFKTKYKIADIQDPLVKALQDYAGLKAICPMIDAYGGEIDLLLENLKTYTGPVPATYVFYAGSVFGGGSGTYDETPTFTIVTVAKDLRGGSALQGAAYAIIEQQKEAVINNNLGLDIEPFRPVKVEATMITNMFSVYSFDIQTFFSMD